MPVEPRKRRLGLTHITLPRPLVNRTPSILTLAAGTGRRSSSPAAYCLLSPSPRTPPPAASGRRRWSDELRRYDVPRRGRRAAPCPYSPRPVSGTSPRAWPARPRRAGPTAGCGERTGRLFSAPSSIFWRSVLN